MRVSVKPLIDYEDDHLVIIVRQMVQAPVYPGVFAEWNRRNWLACMRGRIGPLFGQTNKFCTILRKGGCRCCSARLACERQSAWRLARGSVGWLLGRDAIEATELGMLCLTQLRSGLLEAAAIPSEALIKDELLPPTLDEVPKIHSISTNVRLYLPVIAALFDPMQVILSGRGTNVAREQ